MDLQLGDKLQMKKNHPCGCNIFKVTRIGMDLKIVCTKCGHEIMLPRTKVEKAIKKIIKDNGEN